jgi:hypothetical protein
MSGRKIGWITLKGLISAKIVRATLTFHDFLQVALTWIDLDGDEHEDDSEEDADEEDDDEDEDERERERMAGSMDHGAMQWYPVYQDARRTLIVMAEDDRYRCT